MTAEEAERLRFRLATHLPGCKVELRSNPLYHTWDYYVVKGDKEFGIAFPPNEGLKTKKEFDYCVRNFKRAFNGER